MQKTLRDGHFKALQGKLELLERLCRALQKERNDLNNRLSLLQEQGEKGSATSPQAKPREPSAEDGEDSEDSAQGDGPETAAVQEALRPPETDPMASPGDSEPAETASTPQD